MIEASFNYLAPMQERPAYWLTKLPVRDARRQEPEPTLDREGFALVRHESAVQDLYDADAVRVRYTPEDYPAMESTEALLLKCYDSQQGVARFTAHTAVDDPGAPEGAASRESIEVRTLAFF